jgi:hypothetical protein
VYFSGGDLSGELLGKSSRPTAPLFLKWVSFSANLSVVTPGVEWGSTGEPGGEAWGEPGGPFDFKGLGLGFGLGLGVFLVFFKDLRSCGSKRVWVPLEWAALLTGCLSDVIFFSFQNHL